jgi:D-glycero-D-manno-heptose 1,7-bisphosphate phosphatase
VSTTGAISSATGRRAVFLDRDGVINENLDGSYVHCWADFRFLPGALEAVAALSRAGYAVVVVTNQAGIARGRMTEAALRAIHDQMIAAVAAAGGRLDAVLYCPHHPDDGCACRKPRPGLFYRAAAELGLDLARSAFVGDTVTDLQAGLAAGCRPILVLTGLGRRARELAAADPDLARLPVVADLPAAVELLLAAGSPA